MSDELFLIDSNSLITPFNDYYSFDLTEKFWIQIKEKIEDGAIILLDMVKDEINTGNDELSTWIKEINQSLILDHRTPDIIENYGNVLEYIQQSPLYKETALQNWAQEKIADPWLIATAKAKDYTLVTFEQKQIIANDRSIHKNAKIPDVAEHFGVKTAKLFYLMRKLNMKL